MNILENAINAQPRPIRNYVLVEPNDSSLTKGGIHLPQQHRPEFPEGKVIGLGSGRRDNGEQHDFEVKVGDRILFKMGAPIINIDGVEYIVLREYPEILMIL